MDLSLNVNGLTNTVEVNTPYNPTISVSENEKTSGDAFEGLYTASMNLFNETNEMQFEAKQQQIDFLTGKTDNMLGVIMAQERALSSLNFTVQVTNRMVEAYQKIMQIQI